MKPGEYEATRSQLQRIQAADKLAKGVQEASWLLGGDDGVRDRAARAARSLAKLAAVDAALGPLSERADELAVLAGELAYELDTYGRRLDRDERTATRLADRLDALQKAVHRTLGEREEVGRLFLVTGDSGVGKSALVLASDTDADLFGIAEDELAATVKWKNGADLAALRGKTIRLRVRLKDADLFALRFAENPLAVAVRVYWPARLMIRSSPDPLKVAIPLTTVTVALVAPPLNVPVLSVSVTCEWSPLTMLPIASVTATEIELSETPATTVVGGIDCQTSFAAAAVLIVTSNEGPVAPPLPAVMV